MKDYNIAVIGIGGVGGYFAGRLAAEFGKDSNSGINVYFIARSEHLEQIKKEGLLLKSEEVGEVLVKPNRAVNMSDFNQLPEIDAFLIAVKGYSLDSICQQIKGQVKEGTVILPLMNGVDIYERITRILDKGKVLPSCVYISSYLEKPGVVCHTTDFARIILGQDGRYLDYKPEKLLDVMKKAGINFEWKADAAPDIWEKYIFIASFALVTSLYDKTIGEVLEDEEMKAVTVNIIKEIAELADKKQVSLPEDIVEQTLAKAGNFSYDTTTSLQRDIKAGKNKNELDLFGKSIIDIGSETGVPTPVTEKVYNKLKKV